MVNIELLGKLRQCSIALDGGKRHLRLDAGVWLRRGRLCKVAPDSQASAWLPSGRNSTWRPVQISGTGSLSIADLLRFDEGLHRSRAIAMAVDVAHC